MILLLGVWGALGLVGFGCGFVADRLAVRRHPRLGLDGTPSGTPWLFFGLIALVCAFTGPMALAAGIGALKASRRAVYLEETLKEIYEGKR